MPDVNKLIAELVEKIKTYRFRDEYGHPLENCCDYLDLIAEIERLQQENELLGSASEAHIQAAALEIVNKIFEDKNVGAVSLGITCPHCNASFGEVNEAIAHDATCPKHPAVIRAEQFADAAEFEARVAISLAYSLAYEEGCTCDQDRCVFGCADCRMKSARLAVEEGMEKEEK